MVCEVHREIMASCHHDFEVAVVALEVFWVEVMVWARWMRMKRN